MKIDIGTTTITYPRSLQLTRADMTRLKDISGSLPKRIAVVIEPEREMSKVSDISSLRDEYDLESGETEEVHDKPWAVLDEGKRSSQITINGKIGRVDKRGPRHAFWHEVLHMLPVPKLIALGGRPQRGESEGEYINRLAASFVGTDADDFDVGKGWNETEHPRWPPGMPVDPVTGWGGGRFRPKNAFSTGEGTGMESVFLFQPDLDRLAAWRRDLSNKIDTVVEAHRDRYFKVKVDLIKLSLMLESTEAEIESSGDEEQVRGLKALRRRIIGEVTDLNREFADIKGRVSFEVREIVRKASLGENLLSLPDPVSISLRTADGETLEFDTGDPGLWSGSRFGPEVRHQYPMPFRGEQMMNGLIYMMENTNRSVIDPESKTKPGAVDVALRTGSDRAKYYPGQDMIEFFHDDISLMTVAHEWGHYLERHNVPLFNRALQLWERRTGPSVKMEPLKNHEPGEVAAAGKFIRPYMGKVYWIDRNDDDIPQPIEVHGTEVVSMGVAGLLYDTVDFWTADREVSELAIDALTGYGIT